MVFKLIKVYFRRLWLPCDFSENRQKKGKKMFKTDKKWQNIAKFEKKCTKLESILNKGRWLRATIE